MKIAEGALYPTVGVRGVADATPGVARGAPDSPAEGADDRHPQHSDLRRRREYATPSRRRRGSRQVEMQAETTRNQVRQAVVGAWGTIRPRSAWCGRPGRDAATKWR